ncbi:substrate-binding domain-containing protein [Geoglobus acetivorans]
MDFGTVTPRIEIFLEYDGKKVADSDAAELLRAIKEKGSILSASHSLGIPYSKAWEILSRIERISGRKVVETRRGGRSGGGAHLTAFGDRLLAVYMKAKMDLEKRTVMAERHSESVFIAYSNDPLFAMVVDRLAGEENVESISPGSGMALAMLTLNEADVACCHLYDAESGEYNIPFLEKFWLLDRVVRLGGFERELVFAFRRDSGIAGLEDGIRKILEGKLRFAARNLGSGTRELARSLFERYARTFGIREASIRGLEYECRTHEDVAYRIANGDADAGILLRYVAEKYGLQAYHLRWERYECFALRDCLYKNGVKKLQELLNSRWFVGMIEFLPGYRLVEGENQ